MCLFYTVFILYYRFGGFRSVGMRNQRNGRGGFGKRGGRGRGRGGRGKGAAPSRDQLDAQLDEYNKKVNEIFF